MKKPDEFLKAYDDTMRKYVYFYDYLPHLLSSLQIAFFSKNEVIMREFSEIDKSTTDFEQKFDQETLALNKMAIDFYELVKKLDQTERELTNEKKQILQKLHEIPINPSSFFQLSVSTRDEVEENLGSRLDKGECKQKRSR